MNKWQIGAVLAVFIMTSSVAEAGFDKSPTSALKDRRETTEANKEQVKLLKELISETKKTNQLLEGLLGAGGGGSNNDGSSEDVGGSSGSSGSDVRKRRR